MAVVFQDAGRSVANAPIPSNDDVKVFGLNAVGTGHGKSGRFKKTCEGLCACVRMCLLGQLEVRRGASVGFSFLLIRRTYFFAVL